MSDRRDRDTEPHELAPTSVGGTLPNAGHQHDGWTPIEGAPDWLNEKDRRDHRERRLLFADNELVRQEIRALSQSVRSHLDQHDQDIAALQSRLREAEREVAQLKRDLDRLQSDGK